MNFHLNFNIGFTFLPLWVDYLLFFLIIRNLDFLYWPELLPTPPLDGARSVAGHVTLRHQQLPLLRLGGHFVQAVGKHCHRGLYLADKSLEQLTHYKKYYCGPRAIMKCHSAKSLLLILNLCLKWTVIFVLTTSYIYTGMPLWPHRPSCPCRNGRPASRGGSQGGRRGRIRWRAESRSRRTPWWSVPSSWPASGSHAPPS